MFNFKQTLANRRKMDDREFFLSFMPENILIQLLKQYDSKKEEIERKRKEKNVSQEKAIFSLHGSKDFEEIFYVTIRSNITNDIIEQISFMSDEDAVKQVFKTLKENIKKEGYNPVDQKTVGREIERFSINL